MHISFLGRGCTYVIFLYFMNAGSHDEEGAAFSDR